MKQITKSVLAMALFALLQTPLYAQSADSLYTSYTQFLSKEQTSAKDYVLSLFDKYDIVVLCERDHREVTQYNLILNIANDSRFINNVGNIYTEIGNVNNNDKLNRLQFDNWLTTSQIEEKIMELHRNSYGAGLWEKANYSYLIKGIYSINKVLPKKQKIRLFNLDLGIKDWQTATVNEVRHLNCLMSKRDSLLADNFISLYKKQNTKKALVILNFRHAFLKDLFGRENAGRYIAEAFPDKVANVFISATALANDSKHPMRAIAGGRWDTAFKESGKLDVGFNLTDSPFGSTRFDLIPVENNFTYGDFFTGMVYYRYLPELRTICGMKGFVDEKFLPQLLKRYRLEHDAIGTDIPSGKELKERYNTVTDMRYNDDPMAAIAIRQIHSFEEKIKNNQEKM